MKELIENFPEQILEGLKLMEGVVFKTNPVNNVIICGMGGSGISGSIISELVKKHIKVPITVNKDYYLPNYISENSLVILSSYSGNTEETLSCLKDAISKKAQIVIVSSGGELEKFAKKTDNILIKIPGGNPPRASIGYSFVSIIHILEKYNLLNKDFKSDLLNSCSLLKSKKDDIKFLAKEIANQIYKGSKTAILYSSTEFEPLMIRARQQLNENSEILCWNHTIPEMNHNEIVGWSDDREDLLVIFVRSNLINHDRIKLRYDICEEIISNNSPSTNIINLNLIGESHLEQILFGNSIFDWASIFLAELREVDPNEIKNIDTLKSKLQINAE